MSENIENLLLEHLKSIQNVLTDLKTGQRLTNERLGAIEHHMAGFHVTVSHHQEDIQSLKIRLERIEKRLELREQ